MASLIASIVPSMRGKDKLLYNGYLYTLNKVHGNRFHWVCEKRSLCSVNVTTQVDTNSSHVLSKSVPPHQSHPPTDSSSVAFAALRSDLKRKATDSSDAACKLSRTALGTLDFHPSEKPSDKSLRQVVHRARRAQLPTEPTDASTIVGLQDPYTTTLHSQPFYREKVTLDNGGTLLLFCSDRDLQRLAGSSLWLMDGTFATVPKAFTQLYTLHCQSDQGIFPAVYALGTHKTEESYSKLLRHVIDLSIVNG